TDHEGGKDWAQTLRAAREWNAPGTFATFVAYEYSRGRRFGHRNVIYRDDDGAHPTPDDTNELWQDLPPGRPLGIPHHPNTHSAMPGSRLDNMGGVEPEEFVTGGLTAVWAPELTREALFEALHARRTYATTTARILVDFRVNDAPMGSEIARPADGKVRVRGA